MGTSTKLFWPKIFMCVAWSRPYVSCVPDLLLVACMNDYLHALEFPEQTTFAHHPLDRAWEAIQDLFESILETDEILLESQSSALRFLAVYTNKHPTRIYANNNHNNQNHNINNHSNNHNNNHNHNNHNNNDIKKIIIIIIIQYLGIKSKG